MSLSVENHLRATKEEQQYNEQFEERIRTEVYRMHGISEDKLQGMTEYRNAWYQRKKEKSSIPHDFKICAQAAEEHGFWQLGEVLAYHRRHEHNTGGEEHRIHKLLNKKRKLKEISDYRTILDAFEREQVMRTEDGLLALKQKQKSMKGRQEALLSGKIVSVLKNAWRYRGEVRGATLVCDLLIVKQKDGDRYEIK